MNHFIKSTDHNSLFASLEAAGLLTNTYNEDGEVVSQTPIAGVSLDVVGVISKPTNVVDLEGFPVMKVLDGYHANLIAELTPEQEAMLPLIAAPTNPVRVWA